MKAEEEYLPKSKVGKRSQSMCVWVEVVWGVTNLPKLKKDPKTANEVEYSLVYIPTSNIL